MSVFDDLRFAARGLARAPGFSLIAVLTLALGIGANAAVFTVASAVLIKRLPYPDPDRLVAIQFESRVAGPTDSMVPSPAFAAFQVRSQTLEGVAAYTIGEMPVRLPGGQQIAVQAAFVSPNLFRVLGVHGVQAGRPLRPEDSKRGASRVAVATDRFWRLRGGAAQDFTPLHLGGGLTVVGVLPPSFQFPDVLAPHLLMPLVMPPDDVVASLRVIARLQPGVSVTSAESELTWIIEAVAASFPPAMTERMQKGHRPRLQPLQDHLAADFRPVLLIALAVAGLVLLLACANVSALLLARTKRRDRELAVRSALGGTPIRLARLLFAESAILAVLGAIAATLVLTWSLTELRDALVGTAPNAEAIAIDAKTGTFTFVATLLAACFCAAIPIRGLFAPEARRRASKSGPPLSLSRLSSRQTAGGILVVGQVTGATVLLISALLLLSTLWRLTSVDLGFNPDNLLTLRMPAQGQGWSGRREFALEEILRTVRALPHVQSVAATTSLPLDGHAFNVAIAIEGQPRAEGSTSLDVVSPGYFSTMMIRLRSGREFKPRDTFSAPRVAIVNEAFLRQRGLSEAKALGRRIALASDPQYAAKDSRWSIEIAGIVDNVKDQSPGEDARPIVYLPFEQAAPQIGWHTAKMVVRTASDPAKASEPVRQTIKSVLSGVTIYDVQPMDRRIAALVAPERQRAVIFGFFGVTAVALAAIGLYGLLAQVATQQMREFGIRMAIGASGIHLAWLILRRGLQPVVIGVGIGLIAAQLLTRQLKAMFYEVSALDPASYAAASAIMLCVAMIASYFPARRAMRADPLEILRSE